MFKQQDSGTKITSVQKQLQFNDNLQQHNIGTGNSKNINGRNNSPEIGPFTCPVVSKQIFRTMEHGDFTQESAQVTNFIKNARNNCNKNEQQPQSIKNDHDEKNGNMRQLQQLSGQVKREGKFSPLTSPCAGPFTTTATAVAPTNSRKYLQVRHKMQSMQLYSVPAPSYLIGSQGAGGSQSNEARSSHKADSNYSRSSAKVPLVMRHCYANNEAKKRLVEANQAYWLEQQQQKSNNQLGESSSRSKQPPSRSLLNYRSPISNRSEFDIPTVKKVSKKYQQHIFNPKMILLRVQQRSISPRGLNKPQSANIHHQMEGANSANGSRQPSVPLNNNKMGVVYESAASIAERRSRNPLQKAAGGHHTTQQLKIDQSIQQYYTRQMGQDKQHHRSMLSKVKSPPIHGAAAALKKKAFSPNPARKEHHQKLTWAGATSNHHHQISNSNKKSFLSTTQQQQRNLYMTKAPNLRQQRLSNNQLQSSQQTFAAASPLIFSGHSANSANAHNNTTTVRQSRNFKLPISKSNTYYRNNGGKSNQFLCANSPNLNSTSKRDSNINLNTNTTTSLQQTTTSKAQAPHRFQQKKSNQLGSKNTNHIFTRTSHSVVVNPPTTFASSSGQSKHLLTSQTQPPNAGFNGTNSVVVVNGRVGAGSSIFQSTVLSPGKCQEESSQIVGFDTTSSQQQYPPVQTATLVLNSQSQVNTTIKPNVNGGASVPNSAPSGLINSHKQRSSATTIVQQQAFNGNTGFGGGTTLLTTTAATSLLKDYQPTPGKLMSQIQHMSTRVQSKPSLHTGSTLMTAANKQHMQQHNHLQAPQSSMLSSSNKHQALATTAACSTVDAANKGRKSQVIHSQQHLQINSSNTAGQKSNANNANAVSTITPSKFELQPPSTVKKQSQHNNNHGSSAAVAKRSSASGWHLPMTSPMTHHHSSSTALKQQQSGGNKTTAASMTYLTLNSGSQSHVKSRKHCKFNNYSTKQQHSTANTGAQQSRSKESKSQNRGAHQYSSSSRQPSVNTGTRHSKNKTILSPDNTTDKKQRSAFRSTILTQSNKYLDTIESVAEQNNNAGYCNTNIVGGAFSQNPALKSQNSQTEYRVGYSNTNSYNPSQRITKMAIQQQRGDQLIQYNRASGSPKIVSNGVEQEEDDAEIDQQQFNEKHVNDNNHQNNLLQDSDYYIQNQIQKKKSVTAYKLPESANSPRINEKEGLAGIMPLESVGTTAQQHSNTVARRSQGGNKNGNSTIPSQPTKKTFTGRAQAKGPVTYTQQLHAKENMSLRKSQAAQVLASQVKDTTVGVEQEQISARIYVQPLISARSKKGGSLTPSLTASQMQYGTAEKEEENPETALGGGCGERDADCSLNHLPVCCSILTHNPLDHCRQPAAPVTVDQPESNSQQIQFQVPKAKLTKQRSYQNHITSVPQNQQKQSSKNKISDRDSRQNRRNIEQKIHSQINSVAQSNHGSIINLSIAKTESIAFQPSNPLLVLRKMQQEQNYVWLASYDEDVLHDTFLRKISKCNDQCLPWEFVPWRLYDLQVILCNESSLCLRREPGKETLCKIYLVQMDQVHDIVRYKNHMCERKALIRQGVLREGEGFKSMKELKKKYHVDKLKMSHEDEKDNSSDDTLQPSIDLVAAAPDEKTMSVSIPDEGAVRPNQQEQQRLTNQNYIVTMEACREFDDLQDEENPPLYDIIFHEQTAMGLPVVFATNRDQSKLDDNIPQTPSYFKHLRSLKPDQDLMIQLLQGLMQSFPGFAPEDILRHYIEQIPGINGKLSDEELFEIIEKSINGVTIKSDYQNTKLLTPQQTSKMFELMSHQQMDPNDLQSGYQSLSLYNEQQQNIGAEATDRDVVFLGAESSGLLDQNDISENQQLLIDAFNRDFQQNQQNFMNLHSSGLKYKIPGAQSSDTSQVDNFIFQNNINRFSNDVSQEDEEVTPQMEEGGAGANYRKSKSNMLKKMPGTTEKHSRYSNPSNRNPSSHAIRLESGNTTSYQGACQVINFQQPLFRGQHWNNSGFDEQSAHAKEEVSQRVTKINRGSSQGLLSAMTSPPFKQFNKPLNSAKKPVIFSGDNSAFVPTDQITNNSCIDRKPFNKKTVFTKRKYFSSNAPSLSHRANQKQHQAGFEMPVEDFVTNVESIKPVNQDNQSACQNSNSLFIQSVRSRSRNPKTNNSARNEEQKKQKLLKQPKHHHQTAVKENPSSSVAQTKKAIEPGTTNKFELSQDNMMNDEEMMEANERASIQTHRQQVHMKADAAIAATNILGQFEEVIIQDIPTYGEERKQNNKPLENEKNKVKKTAALLTNLGQHQDAAAGVKIYQDEDGNQSTDPVSVRQQIVSELSIRRKRHSTNSKDLNLKIKTSQDISNLDSSQPEIEMYEKVSDIMTSQCRQNIMPESPSKEIILEETKTRPSNSYQKIKPSLSKKIRMPMKSSGKLHVDMKQDKSNNNLNVNKSESTFFQRALDQMNDQQTRKELRQSTTNEQQQQQSWQKQGMKN